MTLLPHYRDLTSNNIQNIGDRVLPGTLLQLYVFLILESKHLYSNHGFIFFEILIIPLSVVSLQ